MPEVSVHHQYEGQPFFSNLKGHDRKRANVLRGRGELEVHNQLAFDKKEALGGKSLFQNDDEIDKEEYSGPRGNPVPHLDGVLSASHTLILECLGS